MSWQNEDGSVTLTPEEAARLRDGVRRWHVGADRPGNAAGNAVLDLACEIRAVLGMEPTR